MAELWVADLPPKENSPEFKRAEYSVLCPSAVDTKKTESNNNPNVLIIDYFRLMEFYSNGPTCKALNSPVLLPDSVYTSTGLRAGYDLRCGNSQSKQHSDQQYRGLSQYVRFRLVESYLEAHLLPFVAPYWL